MKHQISKTIKNPKHQNQVRIIGGQCRGRKISFFEVEGLRPTPDSVRERLFNWLGQDLTGQIVLDLFSGSGALGLEAASRNAAQVVMVEKHRLTARHLQQTVQTLSLAQVEVVHADAMQYLRETAMQFDVVFLDPPFAWNQWTPLFKVLENRLKERSKVYVEAGEIPIIPPWLEMKREGKAGKSHFKLFSYQQVTDKLIFITILISKNWLKREL